MPKKTMLKSRHTTKKSMRKSKKAGYFVKGNKVYYRTKIGKEGSMPKGHVGMVKKWGLKKVSSLKVIR